ncbi:MAG: diguanylate cyclase, partial [Candidatus Eisenbacteria bacterium]|nr:diguanylate cyclase [Candidatus Eisenbacteria bacterium]
MRRSTREMVEFYDTVLNEIREAVYVIDKSHTIVFWNKAAEQLTGYSAEDVVGRSCCWQILAFVDAQGQSLCEGDCPVFHRATQGAIDERVVYLHHKEGHRVPVRIRSVPLMDERGRLRAVMESLQDMSPTMEMHQKMEELEQLAMFDSLTGVANRRYVERALHARLEELQRYSQPLGVLFVDLDSFKDVNDRYGHSAGDRILQMTARTLAHNVRPFDIVGRWGGDEFLVVIPNVTDADLLPLANRLRYLVASSYVELGGDRVRVTVSIGATIAGAGDTYQSVLERLDGLLYQSKLEGRNLISSDFS